MQHVHHEIKTNQKPVSPLAVGLTGIILGAASVAAVALSDQETRKKATKRMKQIKDDLQKWSSQTIHDLQHRTEEVEDKQSRTTPRVKLDAPKTEVSKEVKERLDDLDR